MKRIAVIFVCLFMLSSVGYASPLMDYSAGKGSVDLIWRNSGVNETTPGQVVDYPKKSGNFDGAITLGLGNKFAVQYRDFTSRSANRLYLEQDGDTDSVYEQFKTKEYSLLYKLDKNLAAYVGTVRAKVNFVDLTDSQWSGSGSKDASLVGLVGSFEVAPKTNLYASVAAGSDIRTWEAGISYEIAANLELGVNYREVKLDNAIAPDGSRIKFKVNGLGFGVTYKF